MTTGHGEGGVIGMMCCGILAFIVLIGLVIPLEIAAIAISAMSNENSGLCVVKVGSVDLDMALFAIVYGICSLVSHLIRLLQMCFGSTCQQKASKNLFMQSWFNFELLHGIARLVFFVLGCIILASISLQCSKTLRSLYVVTILIVLEQLPLFFISIAIGRALNVE